MSTLINSNLNDLARYSLASGISITFVSACSVVRDKGVSLLCEYEQVL